MKYIDLHNKTFTDPKTDQVSDISIETDGDSLYYISFNYSSNSICFDILDVDPEEYCDKLGIKTYGGCWPETGTVEELWKIVDALNKDLSKKFRNPVEKKEEFKETLKHNDLPW